MIPENFVYPLLLKKFHARRSSVAGLLRVLEKKEYILLCAPLVNLQRQRRQTGAVAVMTTGVAHAGDRGGIGRAASVCHRDCVKVRPESKAWQVPSGPVGSIEPAAFVHQLNPGRIPAQKVHQMSLCPDLLVGKLRMGVQLAAKLDCQLIIAVLQSSSLLLF